MTVGFMLKKDDRGERSQHWPFDSARVFSKTPFRVKFHFEGGSALEGVFSRSWNDSDPCLTCATRWISFSYYLDLVQAVPGGRESVNGKLYSIVINTLLCFIIRLCVRQKFRFFISFGAKTPKPGGWQLAARRHVFETCEMNEPWKGGGEPGG
jgi:hypothetical protein